MLTMLLSISPDQANNELLDTKRERDMLKEEKEREVGALHNKLDVMQTSYEAIIQVIHS